MHEESDVLTLDYGQKPDIEQLIDSFSSTCSSLTEWNDQQKTNRETRFCIWTNQDLRTNKKTHKGAQPWKGASDLRVFIVDEQIRKDKSLLKMSLKRGALQANPVEGGDVRQAALVSQFMRWLVLTQMTEIDREVELLADYYLQEGLGVINTYWKRDVISFLSDITLEELLEGTDPEHQQIIINLIQDPENETEAAEAMLGIFPDIGKRQARKMVKSLREEGAMEFPQKDVVCNRPAIRARSLGRDIFFAENVVGEIQKAPAIYTLDYYTPEDLHSQIELSGWKKSWVERTSEIKATSDTLNIADNTDAFTQINNSDNDENLIPVVCAYYKAINKQGIQAIQYCVFSPDIPDDYAFADLLDYRPARYPFYEFALEVYGPKLINTRGYPELAKNFQQEIKSQRDMRIDAGWLRTIPPREGPPNRKPVDFGPGSYLPTRVPGEYRFADVPNFDPGSVEIENTVLANMRAYFGEGENDIANNEIKQELIDSWLTGWTKVLKDIYQLHHQFGNEIEKFRVMGATQKDVIMFQKANLSEKYDFYLSFAALSLDSEKYLKQLEALGDAMSKYNQRGTANFDGLLRTIANHINPTLGDEVIFPEEVATMKEVKETQDDFTNMMGGIAVDPPQNSNAQLRISVMQGIVDGTPDFPATDVQKALSESPEKQNRITKYIEKLQFQIEQRQNAQIGQLGGVPGGGIPER